MAPEKPLSILREIFLIGISPLLFINGICRSGLFRYPPHHVVSLSPKTNTCNDHLGFPYFHTSTRSFGLFGNNHRIMIGDFLGAKVPFLQYLIPYWGGVPLYLVLSLLCYGGYWVYFSSNRPIIGFLSIFYFYCTPYFKNNALHTGRLDFMGWPLAFFSLTYLIEGGSPIVAAVPIVVATFMHLSIPLCMIGMGGAMVLTAFWFHEHDMAIRLVQTGLIISAFTFWWFIPFFRISNLLSLHQRTWNLEDTKGEDQSRRLTICIRKTVLYAAFACYHLPVITFPEAILLFFPILASIFEQATKRLINRFSIESIMLVSATYVLLHHIEMMSYLLFFIAFYSYSSPSKRYGFDFQAMQISPCIQETFYKMFSGMNPEKGRVLFLKSNHDFADKMADIKRVGLLAAGLLLNKMKNLEYCYAAMSRGNKLIDIDRYTMIYPPRPILNIDELSIDWEVRYIVISSEHLFSSLSAVGYRPISIYSVERFGTLPEFNTYIFETSFDRRDIDRDLKVMPNRMEIRLNGHSEIFIPYRAYGWIPDDAAVTKRYVGHGFYLKGPISRKVTLNYKYFSYFNSSHKETVAS